MYVCLFISELEAFVLEPLCSWWRLFQACSQNGQISSASGVLCITEVFARVFFLGSKVLCSSQTIWNWNYLFSTTVPNILLQPTESQSTRLLYRWTADSKWRCKNKQTDNNQMISVSWFNFNLTFITDKWNLLFSAIIWMLYQSALN